MIHALPPVFKYCHKSLHNLARSDISEVPSVLGRHGRHMQQGLCCIAQGTKLQDIPVVLPSNIYTQNTVTHNAI